MSQDALAEAAGVSLTTVKKAESGLRGTVNTATLRKIAEALGVETVTLYTTSAPIPPPTDEGEHRALAELRAAITPPVGINGTTVLDDRGGSVDLAQLDAAIWRGLADYRADHYDRVADTLPGIVRSSHRAVGEHGTPDAHRARARALQLTGRYLTQIRQLDLATTVLQSSIRDAAVAGDRTLAAISIIGQGWALTRAGRLDEVERLCTVTADEIEPRVSTASREELAAWGELLLRASSAAIRNNAPDRARDIMTIARSAAAAVGAEYEAWGIFGPLSVAARESEHALIEDHPDQALTLAQPLLDRGGMSPVSWHRHRLDVAHARVLTRDVDRATGVLRELRIEAPEWLRRQRVAHTVVQAILEARPRTLTTEQRTLATLLRVDR